MWYEGAQQQQRGAAKTENSPSRDGNGLTHMRDLGRFCCDAVQQLQSLQTL